jgi:outer membrane lipoprotein-sorting protein
MLAISLPLLFSMTGCLSLLTSKRKLPIPVAPSTVQTVTAEQLVEQLNAAYEKFESLTATVDIQASRLKAKEGTATDYPTFRANILIRKPEMVRVLGRLPIVQTQMFDLASDGKNFTLVIPHFSKVYQGLNASKGSSPNWYENLRPAPFYGAMVVKGLAPDELYSVISETVTTEAPDKKRLIASPEYLLNVVRRKPDSMQLYPVRVIRFHREDLLPYQQDLYDDQGTLQTQVVYGAYKDFAGVKYPGTMTLRDPQNGYQLIMTVERVTLNPPLTDDMFHTKVPTGYAVTELH